MGIWIQAADSTARHNQVVATGGTTANGPDSAAFGIVVEGAGARVLANDVTGTLSQGNEVAYGIYLREAPSAVVTGNRIAGSAGYGVYLDRSANLAVTNNRLTGFDDGVAFGAGSLGRYRDNLTSGVARPYSGGQDAGNNQ
jgi:parallel beta-helix repeat protein